MTRRELEKLFVEPSELRSGHSNAAHFDSLAHASRALEGTDLSGFEISAAQASIFARLDAQEPGDVEVVFQAPAANSNRSRIFMAVGAVAIALLMIPLFANDDRETSEWQARSAQLVASRDLPKVHVYCVRSDDQNVAFIGQHESPFGVISCRPTDDLKIAYENPDSSLKFAYFAGLSSTRETLWYGPTPTDSTPFSVGITREPTPLGETRRLAVNHSAGRYDVVGVFSERLLTFSEFETMVERTKIKDDQFGQTPGVVLVHAEFEVKP